MGNMFGLFELLLGAYMLYCAFTGKGQIFRNENIKKGLEALYAKRMRLISALLGPVMVAMGVVDLYKAQRQISLLNALFTILFILSALLIALLFVVSLRMTDRAKAQQTAGKNTSAPDAAFIFDEENEKNTPGGI